MTAVAGAAHVFVDDVDAPVLAADDGRHLVRALRLRDGEVVTASDGRGAWRACRLRVPSGGPPLLDPDGDVDRTPAPAPAITVAFAVPKGDRVEWAVQKLTEAGVDRVLLLHAARSVVRWDDDGRAGRRIERLRRVAREAAMQSRRVWLPSIDGPVAFTDAVDAPGVCLADAGGGPPSLAHPFVLVGPEGGWTDDERSTRADVPRVALGPHVLRAETAAVAAGLLLAALREGLVETCGE
jgi:16S rRNA (uracil1498-N3)-methyltransferase